MLILKRLGLFLYFDSDGVGDEYIEYLLKDINPELSHLCVIVNGKLNSKGEKIFKKYTDDIFFRSNLGFDAGAWKDAMIDHLGFDKVSEFDEVILFNDSFFGPIYPFKIMFDITSLPYVVMLSIGLFSLLLTCKPVKNPTVVGGALFVSKVSYGIYLMHIVFISFFTSLSFNSKIPLVIQPLTIAIITFFFSLLLFGILDKMKLTKWLC